MRREKVVLEKRKALTKKRKALAHQKADGVCWWCGREVPMSGPDVEYDHRITLAMGGKDDDIWPLHARPCHAEKTKQDLRQIAKMRRQEKMADPRPPSTMKSRGFPKVTVKRPWPSRPLGGHRAFGKDR